MSSITENWTAEELHEAEYMLEWSKRNAPRVFAQTRREERRARREAGIVRLPRAKEPNRKTVLLRETDPKVW